jgi:hypothetical protein
VGSAALAVVGAVALLFVGRLRAARRSFRRARRRERRRPRQRPRRQRLASRSSSSWSKGCTARPAPSPCVPPPESVPGVVDVQVTMGPGRARVRYRPSETDSGAHRRRDHGLGLPSARGEPVTDEAKSTVDLSGLFAHAESAARDEVPGLVRTIMILLMRGEPITLEEIGTSSRLALETVRESLKAWRDIEYDDEGRLVGLGLTLRPTEHRFLIEGREALHMVRARHPHLSRNPRRSRGGQVRVPCDRLPDSVRGRSRRRAQAGPRERDGLSRRPRRHGLDSRQLLPSGALLCFARCRTGVDWRAPRRLGRVRSRSPPDGPGTGKGSIRFVDALLLTSAVFTRPRASWTDRGRGTAGSRCRPRSARCRWRARGSRRDRHGVPIAERVTSARSVRPPPPST